MSGSLGQLKQLMFLDASKNQLASLPGEIEGCTSLADLHLTSNCLRELPDSLGKLTFFLFLDLFFGMFWGCLFLCLFFVLYYSVTYNGLYKEDDTIQTNHINFLTEKTPDKHNACLLTTLNNFCFLLSTHNHVNESLLLT